MRVILFSIGLGLFIVGCKGQEEDASGPAPATTGAAQSAAGQATFGSVQSIFNQRCMPCHGNNAKQGIDLRTYESVMKGGNEGAVVTPGDPANSVLIQALRGQNGKKQMPSKQPPLPEGQIKQIEDWIRAGAKA